MEDGLSSNASDTINSKETMPTELVGMSSFCFFQQLPLEEQLKLNLPFNEATLLAI